MQPSLIRRMTSATTPRNWVFFAAASTILAISGCILDRSGAAIGGAGGAGGMQAGVAQGGGMPSAGGMGGAGGVNAGGAGADGGAGGRPNLCGNGALDSGEGCDDGNLIATDGCDGACDPLPGYECSGEPSICLIIAAGAYSATDQDRVIPDDESYNGDLGSMTCIEVPVPASEYDELQTIAVVTAIDHRWLGDLVIKLASPSGTIVTLLSRAGVNDPKDSSFEENGDNSNLIKEYPITFDDNGLHDAEGMGGGLSDSEEVCEDDQKCIFFPHSEHSNDKLAVLKGEDPAGTWRLCAADGDDGDEGRLHDVILNILAW